MRSSNSKPSVAASLAAGLLALMFASHDARAATPEIVTVSPTDTAKTWQPPLLVGTNAASRSTCVEDVSCDTVQIVVQPGDWTGKAIEVSITWTIQGNDWDLYVFRDRLDGPDAGSSHGFIPQNSELVKIAVDAVLASPRVYVAHVVGSSATPEQVQGHVRVAPAAAMRTPVLNFANDITFSYTTTVLAPVAARDCEPSIRVDRKGDCYVGGIRGVPAGVDLWRFDLDPSSPGFDPELRHPTYLGQPDAFGGGNNDGGRDGGGDIDIATAFPTNPGHDPEVTIVSLAAANISSSVSTDRGDHFNMTSAVATVPADDRQWIEAAGPDTIYLLYRAPIPATGLFVQRSTDHGATYPLTSLVNPTGTTPGYVDVDHRNGVVYAAHQSDGAAMVSRSSDQGLTWRTVTVDNATGHGHFFDVVKVDDAGNVYLAWCDQHAIYLAHSTDGGETWSRPVKIASPAFQQALFPWLEVGSAGRAALVWYGSSSAVHNNDSDWHCWAAITTDALAESPVFQVTQLSDHVIHASNISEGGLTIPVIEPEPNRNLCDYFQVAIDPQGACVVAFTDDHNDFDGHTFVSRQLSGPSLYASANGGTGVLVPHARTPLPAQDPQLPEVSDFLHDAATGAGLQVIPTDSPYDILSIDYRCGTPVGTSPVLETRMKVSALAPVPANSFWRVNFAANAPGSTADRGLQFFVRASTGADPTSPTFTFGTAVRDTSGTLVYTDRGPAYSGAFDTTTNEVIVRLPASALAPYVTQGPPITLGSVLVGLKGSTGTSSANGARDETRGSNATFTFCQELASVEPERRLSFGLGSPRPNPSRSGTSVDMTLSHAGWTELSVFDVTGRRVRTVFAGMLPPGVSHAKWDGRTDDWKQAPSGIYWLRMVVGGQTRGQRLVMVK